MAMTLSGVTCGKKKGIVKEPQHENATLATCLDAASRAHLSNQEATARAQIPRNAARDHVLSSKIVFELISIAEFRQICLKTSKMICHALGKGLVIF